jgi:hypothetical protein
MIVVINPLLLFENGILDFNLRVLSNLLGVSPPLATYWFSIVEPRAVPKYEANIWTSLFLRVANARWISIRNKYQRQRVIVRMIMLATGRAADRLLTVTSTLLDHVIRIDILIIGTPCATILELCWRGDGIWSLLDVIIEGHRIIGIHISHGINSQPAAQGLRWHYKKELKQQSAAAAILAGFFRHCLLRVRECPFWPQCLQTILLSTFLRLAAGFFVAAASRRSGVTIDSALVHVHPG